MLIQKGLVRVILDRLDGDVRKNMDICLQTGNEDLNKLSDAELIARLPATPELS